MNHRLFTLPALSLTAILGTLAAPETGTEPATDAAPASFVDWEVRITNLTPGQIFSPAVAVVHDRAMQPVWRLGAPASTELRLLAEDAQSAALVCALQASRHVSDVKPLALNGGPIPPGATASVVVSGVPGRFNRLTLAGMLVTTNDAFYGVSGLRLPATGKKTRMAPAYDAGTEANTEDCAHIPGPPCGSGGVRVTQGAEGFVHVHSGIHGGASLDPAEFDWRNPAVRIEVRRL